MFGRGGKHVAEEAAAAAEVERLCAMPAPVLGAELILAFGPNGPSGKGRLGVPAMALVQWLMASHPRHPSLRALADFVVAAMQALEHAGLVIDRTPSTGSGANYYSLTPLGETALADGSFLGDLGLSMDASAG
jgi:hypothetical protein